MPPRTYAADSVTLYIGGAPVEGAFDGGALDDYSVEWAHAPAENRAERRAAARRARRRAR